MKPRRVKDSNLCFSLEGGNEDNFMWAMRALDKNEIPILITTWELTKKERRQIREGGTIQLVVWGIGHPPVALQVAPPLEELKNDLSG